MNDIRREHLDVFNRLHSIAHDLAFVDCVHDAYPNFPMLPNLRCGAWYTNPAKAHNERAYFKSTDGHFNCWSFNLRRPNLHLMPVLVAHRGTLLVDSTRAGKRIPDALAKTVPIWCSVLNRAILRRYPHHDLSDAGWDTTLYTPPTSVSQQEHDQIEARLDGWTDTLVASSYALPDLPHPLRPFWITPSTSVFPVLPTSYIPIICVSASEVLDDASLRRAGGFAYVQGAADDHELWAMGLSPELFWAHRDTLLSAQRSELPGLVTSIVSRGQISSVVTDQGAPTPIAKVHGRLLLSSASALGSNYSSLSEPDPRVHLVVLGPGRTSHMLSGSEQRTEPTLRILYLDFDLSSRKKGTPDVVRNALPRSIHFIRANLLLEHNICISYTDSSDGDVGVAILLVALQLFFDENGLLRVNAENDQQIAEGQATKQSIRTRLEWIIASCPSVNPARSTLKRVNEFLLSPPSFRAPSES